MRVSSKLIMGGIVNNGVSVGSKAFIQGAREETILNDIVAVQEPPRTEALIAWAKNEDKYALQQVQELNPAPSGGICTLDVGGSVIKSLNIAGLDEQDIRPDTAPSGLEKTEHQYIRKNSKRGRKRIHPRNKANWMPNPWGRYPLASQLRQFLEATNGYYAPITQKERTRKAHRIAAMIVELGAEPNVKEWTKHDILAWKQYVDAKLDNATKVKYWRFLREFLSYHEMDFLRKMIEKKEIKMPQIPPKEIRSLKERTIWDIHKAVQDMEGWEGDIARFVTLFYPFTGLRPSELRTQNLSDIDLDNWTLTVSHPKGGDTYGRKRTIAIPPLIRQPFLSYLEVRKKYLLEKKSDEKSIDLLIPYKSRQGMVAYPDAVWRAFKCRLQKHAGIPFRWKDYRSSFCQIAIDKGMDAKAVSKMMGHSTTMTTELFYGRIKDSPAIAEMNRVFSEPKPEDLRS